MANHGVFVSEQATSVSTPVVANSGVPFVVGPAPVQSAESPASVGVPVLCTNWAEAVEKLGYSDNWGNYPLCEFMTAVETGEDLDEYARIANMSADEFSKAWGEDAAGALASFVTGLSDTSRIGSSAIVTLNDLGITETRMQRTILSLSNSGDLLTNAISDANQA